MVILPSEPLTKDYKLSEIAEFDTKAAILASFDILNVGVAKSYRKAELAFILGQLFNNNPAFFLNVLPEEEQKLISKLAAYPGYPTISVSCNCLAAVHSSISSRRTSSWTLRKRNSKCRAKN